MRTLSTAWKFFILSGVLSAVMAAIGTFHLMSNRLAQIGSDPDLALPPLMVAATSFMTFFGILIPLVALVGVVFVIIDGYSRGKTNHTGEPLN